MTLANNNKIIDNRATNTMSLAIREVDLEKLFHSTFLPNAFYWHKDTQSRYLYCNEAQAEAAGTDSAQQMLGKTDFDMCWRRRAGLYQLTDRLVMQGNMLYANENEKVQTVSKELTMLVTKYKLVDKNDICIGVVGINIDVTSYSFIKKVGNFDDTKKLFYLGNYFGNTYLTRRELDVLKFLMHGFTAKKIAICLKISFRTVEAYINLLKDKLLCKSKSDIVAIAIEGGLIYLLIDELQNCEYNQ